MVNPCSYLFINIFGFQIDETMVRLEYIFDFSAVCTGLVTSIIVISPTIVLAYPTYPEEIFPHFPIIEIAFDCFQKDLVRLITRFRRHAVVLPRATRVCLHLLQFRMTGC
jgi:hypothetical protein